MIVDFCIYADHTYTCHFYFRHLQFSDALWYMYYPVYF